MLLTEITLQTGSSKTIKAYAMYSDGTRQVISSVKSSVENPEVASIDELVVTAKKGQKLTTITLSYAESNGEQLEVEIPLTVIKSETSGNKVLGMLIIPGAIIAASRSSTPLKAEWNERGKCV